MDGVVETGTSDVDESMLTGESVPCTQAARRQTSTARRSTDAAAWIFAATRVGRDTMLSSIIRLVEEAQGSRAPIQRLADLISAYFVPAVIGVAGVGDPCLAGVRTGAQLRHGHPDRRGGA